MPAVLPTSYWSSSIDALRSSFASCEAFQEWTNTTTVEAALRRIHFQSKPHSGQIYPYLIIMQRTGLTYRYQTADYIVGKSQFADLFFEMRAKSIGLPDDFYTIANPVGAIIEELVANSGIGNPGGFINEAIAELLEVPHWNEEGEQATEGPILSCKWRLTWS